MGKITRALAGLTLVLMGCGDDAMVDPDGGTACEASSDCDDGLFCNGTETCTGGLCVPGTSPCSGSCDETTGRCSDGTCPDADDDGHEDAACGGDDCDDSDPNRFPGNAEICDAAGLDEDCDATTFGDTDADGDGAISAECCNGATCGDDCNDATLAQRPGQLEICDSVDNDCDGAVDEAMNEVVWYEDDDGDGFGSSTEVRTSCVPIPGASLVDTDCEDGVPQANPAGVETCNTVDDDCDGMVDEGLMDCDPCIDGPDVCDGIDLDCDGVVDEDPSENDFFTDADGDGVGTGVAMAMSACRAAGFARRSGDCDDADPSVGDGAFPELCDGLDNDCDSSIDEGLVACMPDGCDLPLVGAVPFELQVDSAENCGPGVGDGLLAMTVRVVAGEGGSYDGMVLRNVVSSSAGSRRSSTTWEIPKDTDITVVTQLGTGQYLTIAFRWDSATDQVTVSSLLFEACSTRMAAEATDECNGIDENCSGSADEGIIVTLYSDLDGDGFGGAESGTRSCGTAVPPDTVLSGTDCDDFDATIYPGAPELCDTLSNDCDVSVDEGTDICALPNAASTCDTGTCTLGACDGGFEDCDGLASTGCEAELAADPSNCGSCGARCFDGCSASACSAESPITGISIAGDRGCALRSSGRVLCWGRVDEADRVLAFGEDADPASRGCIQPPGSFDWRCDPFTLPVSDAVEVSTSDVHGCVRHTDGSVSCWGQPGAFGSPTCAASAAGSCPVTTLPGISDAVQVVAFGGTGISGTCIRHAGGGVTCSDTLGGLSPVAGIGDAVDVGARGQICVARATGRVLCWLPGVSPAAVAGVNGALDVEVGQEFVCARTASSVLCWGENGAGQLGNGSTAASATPVTTLAMAVDDLASTDFASCAVTSSGETLCWGYSEAFPNEIGGTLLTPAAIESLGGAVEVAVQEVDLCVRRSDGRVRCQRRDPLPGSWGDGMIRLSTADYCPSFGGPCLDPAEGCVSSGASCAAPTVVPETTDWPGGTGTLIATPATVSVALAGDDFEDCVRVAMDAGTALRVADESCAVSFVGAGSSSPAGVIVQMPDGGFASGSCTVWAASTTTGNANICFQGSDGPVAADYRIEVSPAP